MTRYGAGRLTTNEPELVKIREARFQSETRKRVFDAISRSWSGRD
jgi:hypothetical protein